MLTYPYHLIKNRVTSKVPELKEIDWFLNQYDPSGPGIIYTAPGLYIEFLPFDTQSLGGGVQMAAAEFRMHLVSDNVFDNDKRIRKTTPTDHANLIDKTYNAVYKYRGLLSDLPEFAALAGTENDFRLINSIDRTGVVPPHNLSGLMVTVQSFRCVLYDHTATKAWQSIAPDLEITSDLV